MLKNKTAFSLIELSVVILIIGVIVSGVTQSSRMISAFRLSSARSQTQSSPVASMRNLLMWYDSTSVASFLDADAENNQPITFWYDINPTSTIKYDLTSPSTNNPKYIANCINSLPCVRFDGSNDYLINNSADISGTELTIFIVAKRIAFSIYTTTLSVSAAAVSNDFTSTSSMIVFNEGGNGTYIQTYRNGGLSGIMTHPGNGVAYVAETVFNGATNTFYLNGTAQSSVASTASFAASRFLVGSRWEASLYQWPYNGNIAEIIVFSRGLKTEERDAVESYLGKKWGITVS